MPGLDDESEHFLSLEDGDINSPLPTASWLVDVVQKAALIARNLQKIHTGKPTKSLARRPSVGQTTA